MRELLPVALCLVLSACARPADGPSASDIYNAKIAGTNERIQVVDLAKAPAGVASSAPLSYLPNDRGLSVSALLYERGAGFRSACDLRPFQPREHGGRRQRR